MTTLCYDILITLYFKIYASTFCTYTCTELPRVPLCCHFTTYYSFPKKKSFPELNDQPTYQLQFVEPVKLCISREALQ